MLSFKFNHWSILIVVLTFASCSQKPSNEKRYANYLPKQENLINPYWVEFIEDAPTRTPDCWNKTVLNSLEISTIQMQVFGGENPEDTLEKKRFSYSNHSSTLNYEDFKFAETPSIWSKGTVRWYKDFNELDINFTRHFGINRAISSRAEKKEDYTLLLRKKSGNNFDSTFIYGSISEPELIITKIGKNVYSIDAYVSSSASTDQIKSAFSKVKRNENELLFTQRSVIFVENGRPTSAFLLDENFVQVAQIKHWEYDENWNLISYQEFIGNAVVRDIVIDYRADLLPESITVDRKKYFCTYN